jgi:peptidyl-prolyl cis-trans isomerase SDCCAG10
LSSKVGLELPGSEKESDSEEEEEEEQIQQQKEEPVDIDSIKKKLSKGKNPSSLAKGKPLKRTASEAEDDDEDEDLKDKLKKREAIIKEIKALKREMRGEKKDAVAVGEDPVAKKAKRNLTDEEKANDLLLSFHKERDVYASKKPLPKKGADREAMTMQLLEKFKSKLHAVKVEGVEVKSQSQKQLEDEEEEEVAGDDWMANTLHFEKNDPVLAKDASSKDDDWFDIYDPRNPVNKRRRGERDKKEKDRKKH